MRAALCGLVLLVGAILFAVGYVGLNWYLVTAAILVMAAAFMSGAVGGSSKAPVTVSHDSDRDSATRH